MRGVPYFGDRPRFVDTDEPGPFLFGDSVPTWGDTQVMTAAVVAGGLGVEVGDSRLFADPDLNLDAGLTLTGGDGTGRSTLPHCPYGLRPPTGGGIRILGARPDERSVPLVIGLPVVAPVAAIPIVLGLAAYGVAR